MVKRIECRIIDSAPAIAPLEPPAGGDDYPPTVLNEIYCSACGSPHTAEPIPRECEFTLYDRRRRLELGLVVDCYA